MEHFACLIRFWTWDHIKIDCLATGNFANPEKKIECASSKTTISYEFLSHSPVRDGTYPEERAVEIAGKGIMVI